MMLSRLQGVVRDMIAKTCVEHDVYHHLRNLWCTKKKAIVREYALILLHFRSLAALTHAHSWGSIPLPLPIATHGLVLPKERDHLQGGGIFVPEDPFSPSHTAKPVDFAQFDILGPEIATTAVLSNFHLIHVTV